MMYKPTCGGVHNLELNNAKGLSISDRLIKAIFDGKHDKGKLDLELYDQTSKILQDGLDDSFGLNFEFDSPSNEMRGYLRNNVFKFAGSKNLTMINDIRAALLDDDGKPKLFNDFKTDVLKINEQYNVNWLRSEYQHAIAQGQHAANWQKFEEDADLYPNLRYQTIEDDRVRPEHDALNGIIRPVNDPFWSSYAPQNGWGCRCSLVPEGEDVETTDKPEAVGRGKAAKVTKAFKNNPGTTGVIYTDNHPYFISNGKTSNMKAANYGLREVDTIYANPNKLAKYKGTIKTVEDYDTWWSDQVKKNGTGSNDEFKLTSAISRISLLFDQELYKKPHTRTRKDQLRHLIADEIPELINNPDEVFSSRANRTRSKDELITTFIRYYNDTAIVLITESLQGANVVRVKSWYKVDDLKGGALDRLRIGILEHKKTSKK